MWVQRLYLVRTLRSFDDFTYSMIRRRKAEIEEARGTGKSTKIKHDILSRFIEQGEDPESYFDRQKPQRCCPGLCESRARYNSNNPLKGYIHVNDT